MSLFIIIQARITSTRLPKKVMLPLCGKTVLETMFDRLNDYKENIIIATTNDGTEEPIVDVCRKNNIKYYRGDTTNVLSRYYEACQRYNVEEKDIVIRCTSDCPFIDKQLLKEALEFFESSEAQYVSLGVHSGFPRGLDVEIFNFSLLKEAFENANSDYEKEHVTPYIHTTIKDKLLIKYFENKKDDSKYRITLDEEDDYIAIKELYKKFDNKIDFTYKQLIEMLESNPYIYNINKSVEQKTK